MQTGWNPDAVAPPCGDVYEREARASRAIARLAGYFTLASLLLGAYVLLHL
jgi:hypothetical protein